MLIIASALVLSGCAPRPDAVAPANVSGYGDGMTCRQAASALNRERQTVASLESAQKSAATGDTIGVFLIAVPLSSVFGGDKSGDLATAKGKVLALESRMSRCGRA